MFIVVSCIRLYSIYVPGAGQARASRDPLFSYPSVSSGGGRLASRTTSNQEPLCRFGSAIMSRPVVVPGFGVSVAFFFLFALILLT
jgi:hypothetical protein